MLRQFRILLCVALVVFPALPSHAQEKLTVEKIYANGRLIGDVPDEFTWSPDGKYLSFQDNGALVEIDPATAQRHVLVNPTQMATMAGAADTEQDKDHRDRYKMAGYFWAPDGKTILFDANGRLWLFDLNKGAGAQVASTGAASGDDPKFSPNGYFVSYIKDHGLWVTRLKEPGTPSAAVAPAPANTDAATVMNGEVDWVYEEELDVRTNYSWSPDSHKLAFLRMEETAVPAYPITDWIPTHATVDMQRYPQPGDANPAVKVGVVASTGGAITWIKLPIVDGQDYIPRFGWADANTVWIETLTRDHKLRSIYLANAATGEAHLAVALKDEKFHPEKYDVDAKNGSIVLTDWADGFIQLYLYQYNAKNPGSITSKRQLTQGSFDVADLLRIDFARGEVDYTSNENDPQQQQVWRVSFDGKRRQLSNGAGFHRGNVSPDGSAFAEEYSTRLHPPTVRLCSGTNPCSTLWETHAADKYALKAPQTLTIPAHDGTPLLATLILPASTGAASVPLIVNPYGGPGAQEIADEWSDSLLFDTVLADHGFAVLHVDNRGMSMRGRAFAQASYHNFGPVQLEDQLTAVDAVLARFPQLDAKRLGWWGWSWGGTFTLYALSHSDRFRAGVSVAPVTDWHNYDSIYTERYMSRPADFPAGYKDFSVVNSAAQLHGRLLLVHGTGDDNVHMENSVQYIQKLIDAQIPYDLQLYPRKTHSIAGPDVRTHLFNRILAHFEQNLK